MCSDSLETSTQKLQELAGAEAQASTMEKDVEQAIALVLSDLYDPPTLRYSQLTP